MIIHVPASEYHLPENLLRKIKGAWEGGMQPICYASDIDWIISLHKTLTSHDDVMQYIIMWELIFPLFHLVQTPENTLRQHYRTV